MPIKFRCEQCGQLLGISRRKIGMAVTCPKCHHPVSVPEEDRVDALPASKTARIFEQSDFDKLIAKRVRSAVQAKAGIEVDDFGQIALLEEDLPDSVDSKLSKPASEHRSKARRQDAPHEGTQGDSKHDSHRSKTEMTPSPSNLAPPRPMPALPVAALERVPEQPVVATLTAKGDESSTAAARLPLSAPPTITTQPSRGEDSRLSLELVAVVGIALAFLAGLAVGRYLVPAPAKDRLNARGDRVAKAGGDPAIVPQAEAAPEPAVAVGAKLTGMIRLKGQGVLKPDARASVIVFPVKKVPTEKIPVDFLRPGGERDAGESRKRLEMYGGGQAFANAQGHYEITVSQPGDFWVLIVSATGLRDKNTAIPVDERASIAQFFGNVEELVGARSFVLVSRKLDAGADGQLNHDFAID